MIEIIQSSSFRYLTMIGATLASVALGAAIVIITARLMKKGDK